MTYDRDHVLCECELPALQRLVAALEERYAVVVVKEPSVCLTMIRAEDSLDRQEFYLGEALTTECEVAVDGHAGYGICLGDQPVRGYCIAVIDALMHVAAPLAPEVDRFVDAERARLAAADAEEFNLVLRTQVDFKLMEQE